MGPAFAGTHASDRKIYLSFSTVVCIIKTSLPSLPQICIISSLISLRLLYDNPFLRSLSSHYVLYCCARSSTFKIIANFRDLFCISHVTRTALAHHMIRYLIHVQDQVTANCCRKTQNANYIKAKYNKQC